MVIVISLLPNNLMLYKPFIKQLQRFIKMFTGDYSVLLVNSEITIY